MNTLRSLVALAAVLLQSTGAEPIKIIETHDPIPDSPGLTAGNTFRHPEVDQGKVAFFTEHFEFGVDKPTQSLLYWDGSTLSKIANSVTPVPGLGGGEQLGFRDLTRPHTMSLDASQGPTVAFYTGYRNTQGEEHAIYKWTPAEGLETMVVPGAALSWIQPGPLRDGVLIFTTQQLTGPEENRGMYRLTADNTLTKIFSPGDDIPGLENGRFEFIQPSYLFNGHRLIINVNTSPTSLGGWWQFSPGAPGGTLPLWTVDDRVEGDGFSFWGVGIQGISPRTDDTQGAAGRGQGTRNGSPTRSILFQPDVGMPWRPIVFQGDSTPGAPGFTFTSFGDILIKNGAVIFSADSGNAAFEQVAGIYQWKNDAVDVLLDTQSQVDGKLVSFLSLHDRDDHSDAILFTASFDDNTAGLYLMPPGATTTLSYDDWAGDEFPDANGDPEIVGLLADPERDGVANLLEFVTGGRGNLVDPQTSAVSVRPPSPDQAQEFEFRRRASLPEGFSVIAKVSTTLNAWQSGSEVVEVVSVTPDPENAALEIVRVRWLGIEGGTAYARLRATHSGID